MLAAFLVSGAYSCSSTVFLERPTTDLELGAVELSNDGRLLGASAITASGDPIEFASSIEEAEELWVLGFDVDDFSELDGLARSLGLDPLQSRRTEKLRLSEGCRSSYPEPRQRWRRDGDRLLETSELSPKIGAAWLDGICPSPGTAPEGFVSAEVLMSECAYCPSTQLQHKGACSARVDVAANLCGVETAAAELRFDWRGEVCVLPGGECASAGARSIRCGDVSPCEIELVRDGFREEDRFATTELIASSTASFGAGPVYLPESSLVVTAWREPAQCLFDGQDRTRLRFSPPNDPGQAFDRWVIGCIDALKANSSSLLLIHRRARDRQLWDFEQRSATGALEAAVSLADDQAPLGLHDRVYWSRHDSWVLSFVQSSTRARLLFLRRQFDQLLPSGGPEFVVPHSGVGLIVEDPASPTSRLRLVSGATMARIEDPDEVAVFRDLIVLGGSVTVPGTDALGTIDGTVWHAGRLTGTQNATIYRVRDDQSIDRAILSEVDGGGRMLSASAIGDIFVSTGREGAHLTRFDRRSWRFLPGTLRIGPAFGDGLNPVRSLVALPDGTIWMEHHDGDTIRVVPQMRP